MIEKKYNRAVLFLLILLSTGCVSIKRCVVDIEPKNSFQVSDDISLTATGPVNINVPFIVDHVDFFPSSFLITSGERAIYIDPLCIGIVKPADYILITHSHGDHYSIDDIKKIITDKTTVICPQKVYKRVKEKTDKCLIRMIAPGETLQFGDVSIEATAAYNLKSGMFVPHPKKAMNVGYVINIDGTKVFHAGDSDFVPEMKDLGHLAAALVPIDGDSLTMSTEAAAEFVNTVRPEYAVPMHYDLRSEGKEEFRKSVSPEIKVVIMD